MFGLRDPWKDKLVRREIRFEDNFLYATFQANQVWRPNEVWHKS